MKKFHQDEYFSNIVHHRRFHYNDLEGARVKFRRYILNINITRAGKRTFITIRIPSETIHQCLIQRRILDEAKPFAEASTLLCPKNVKK